MRTLLILLFLIPSFGIIAQSDCVFTMNYNPANCFNVQPEEVEIKLMDTSGTIKDQMVVIYSDGNPVGTPTSMNGIIVWDGVLTGSINQVILGELIGLTESCILTTQITDNCENRLISGPVQSVPINLKTDQTLSCQDVIDCVLADIDAVVQVNVGQTSSGLDSVTITVDGQPDYIFTDTDTYISHYVSTVAGTDDFGNDYPIGTSILVFPGTEEELCIPNKTDLYTDIDLTVSPGTITDPDGDVVEIYDYVFDLSGDGINVNTDTTGGTITVTYSLDWGEIKDSILSCIPITAPQLTPSK